jgi:hypothetical protein
MRLMSIRTSPSSSRQRRRQTIALASMKASDHEIGFLGGEAPGGLDGPGA